MCENICEKVGINTRRWVGVRDMEGRWVDVRGSMVRCAG